MRNFLLICVCCFATNTGFADEGDLLSGHPRPSYSNVEDINAMAAALRGVGGSGIVCDVGMSMKAASIKTPSKFSKPFFAD